MQTRSLDIGSVLGHLPGIHAAGHNKPLHIFHRLQARLQRPFVTRDTGIHQNAASQFHHGSIDNIIALPDPFRHVAEVCPTAIVALLVNEFLIDTLFPGRQPVLHMPHVERQQMVANATTGGKFATKRHIATV